ncbi:XRE family transcriptional regulator [Cryobacterium sp. Sr8]|uniref:helix-turn-helix transcriptional regulator n=1 Tax=Cryobacterium sp. Sr8 TaxID=1259203 RepID=UPI00106C860E|nr:helix-turn-helix transcriptional regulator [Cryobacterium sp. Sr8]TFD75421.1 XRE family transcriptional regulator [Cryobacterium sp. Sr8]
MFADQLRGARADAHLSIASLAELAGTSRAAVTDYEAGRKIPRVDTAERIFQALGKTYAPVEYPRAWPVRLDNDALAPLAGWAPNRDRMLKKARRDQAVIVDADASAERLEVSWGQVKTIVEGTTVTGDEISVWRVRELSGSAAKVLQGIELGDEPRLTVITRGALVAANSDLDVPRRAIDFLVRATQHGADPAFTRHQIGGFLAHHGYPWLWVPHQLGHDYRRALVACMRQGEGNLMARVLTASIEGA